MHNIALFSTSDGKGGADRAAYRLHRALIDVGMQSRFYTGTKTHDDRTVVELERTASEVRAEKLIQKHYIADNRTEVSDTLFSVTYGWQTHLQELLKNADVVSLHWIEHFVNAGMLEAIVQSGKPIVWTLHDERPFTGGCHYSAGCSGYETDCHACPQLADDPFGLPSMLLQQKFQLLRDANIAVVSPSRWLAACAKKSVLFRDVPVSVIPNSVETEIFSPTEKPAAKQMLGIGADVTTIMFGSQNNKVKRKGFDALLQALEINFRSPRFLEACREKKIAVVLVGDYDKRLEALPVECVSFGHIDDDVKLAQIYSATDVFILPSLEDNLPNTMLESMACGTPVIGFNTGGIPDVVRHDENGLIVEKGNAAALADAIEALVFDSEKRAGFGQSARDLIVSEFTQQRQAEAYRKLFDERISYTLQETPVTRDPAGMDAQLLDPLLGHVCQKVLDEDVGLLPIRLKVESKEGLESAVQKEVELKLAQEQLVTLDYDLRQKSVRLEQLHREFDVLREENDTLKKENEVLREENGAQKKENDALQCQRDKFKEDLRETNARLDDNEKKADMLRRRLTGLESAVNDLFRVKGSRQPIEKYRKYKALEKILKQYKDSK